jgi:small subunit ribosomal protein S1
MPIDCMSVSRINHPKERFLPGQKIKGIIKHASDEMGRITLTHRELLGTWEENASQFSPGQTAAGIVRSVEPYGIFVELTPNLAGLAESKSDVHPGQNAAVYIKSILPGKMKVKLAIIDVCEGDGLMNQYTYPETEHIDQWQYSPAICDKVIETVF